MKQIYCIFAITILLLSSCKKDDITTAPEETLKNIPVLTTIEVTNITATSAKSGGNISNDGGALVTNRGVCWNTTENPVVSGNKTVDGDSSGIFTSQITGLTSGTKYYVRAYATNSVGTSYGSQYSFTTLEENGGKLTFNGFTYQTVKIGTQEWTVENLRTTVYNDGTVIAKVTNGVDWYFLKTGGYCSYDNNDANVSKYGYLYNWFAIESGKLAPLTGGWRIPTDADWTKLTDYIGGSSGAGVKLKAKSGWTNDGNGTDQFGFSALPGSACATDGYFNYLGQYGNWWSSTVDGESTAWYRQISNNNNSVGRFSNDKRLGFSIRLVRDN